MNPSLLGAGCPWLRRSKRVRQLARAVTKPLTEAALGNEPTGLCNAGGPSLRLPQLWRLHEPMAPSGDGGRRRKGGRGAMGDGNTAGRVPSSAVPRRASANGGMELIPARKMASAGSYE